MFITLCVARCLFLRVIPNFFFALRIPLSEQLKCAAASICVAKGFSSQYLRNASWFILYGLRLRGLFSREPISSKSFSQSLSVVLLRPNISLTFVFV
jgi:hypothetical protein